MAPLVLKSLRRWFLLALPLSRNTRSHLPPVSSWRRFIAPCIALQLAIQSADGGSDVNPRSGTAENDQMQVDVFEVHAGVVQRGWRDLNFADSIFVVGDRSIRHEPNVTMHHGPMVQKIVPQFVDDAELIENSLPFGPRFSRPVLRICNPVDKAHRPFDPNAAQHSLGIWSLQMRERPKHSQKGCFDQRKRRYKSAERQMIFVYVFAKELGGALVVRGLGHGKVRQEDRRNRIARGCVAALRTVRARRCEGWPAASNEAGARQAEPPPQITSKGR